MTLKTVIFKTYHLLIALLHFTIIFALEFIYIYHNCIMEITTQWCATAHLLPTLYLTSTW